MITLADTPGFDDSTVSDLEILMELLRRLKDRIRGPEVEWHLEAP
jgi:hypothetical protein